MRSMGHMLHDQTRKVVSLLPLLMSEKKVQISLCILDGQSLRSSVVAPLKAS